MIFRILMLLLLVGFVLWFLKKQFAADNPRQDRSGQDAAEDMLVCETCGVHTPRSMTVQIGGKTYCCEDHARASSPNRSADDD